MNKYCRSGCVTWWLFAPALIAAASSDKIPRPKHEIESKEMHDEALYLLNEYNAYRKQVDSMQKDIETFQQSTVSRRRAICDKYRTDLKICTVPALTQLQKMDISYRDRIMQKITKVLKKQTFQAPPIHSETMDRIEKVTQKLREASLSCEKRKTCRFCFFEIVPLNNLSYELKFQCGPDAPKDDPQYSVAIWEEIITSPQFAQELQLQGFEDNGMESSSLLFPSCGIEMPSQTDYSTIDRTKSMFQKALRSNARRSQCQETLREDLTRLLAYIQVYTQKNPVKLITDFKQVEIKDLVGVRSTQGPWQVGKVTGFQSQGKPLVVVRDDNLSREFDDYREYNYLAPTAPFEFALADPEAGWAETSSKVGSEEEFKISYFSTVRPNCDETEPLKDDASDTYFYNVPLPKTQSEFESAVQTEFDKSRGQGSFTFVGNQIFRKFRTRDAFLDEANEHQVIHALRNAGFSTTAENVYEAIQEATKPTPKYYRAQQISYYANKMGRFRHLPPMRWWDKPEVAGYGNALEIQQGLAKARCLLFDEWMVYARRKDIEGFLDPSPLTWYQKVDANRDWVKDLLESFGVIVK